MRRRSAGSDAAVSRESASSLSSLSDDDEQCDSPFTSDFSVSSSDSQSYISSSSAAGSDVTLGRTPY